jgi:hypothetical protein
MFYVFSIQSPHLFIRFMRGESKKINNRVTSHLIEIIKNKHIYLLLNSKT